MQATVTTPLTAASGEAATRLKALPALWAELPSTPSPAMNEIFKLWGEAAASESSPDQSVESVAAAHGFSVIKLHSMDELLQLDTPAVLELRSDREKTTRIVAITAAGNGTFSIMPLNKGAQPVSRKSLADAWAGKGWVVWKNRLGLPDRLDHNSAVADIRRLQTLLIMEKKLQRKPAEFSASQPPTLCSSCKGKPGLRRTELPMSGRFCLSTAARRLRLRQPSRRLPGKFMSSILKALKKLEEEKSLHESAGINVSREILKQY